MFVGFWFCFKNILSPSKSSIWFRVSSPPVVSKEKPSAKSPNLSLSSSILSLFRFFDVDLLDFFWIFPLQF
jgi:hypothetical protein